jgi:tetratricopeptide (TPR) repeat protein
MIQGIEDELDMIEKNLLSVNKAANPLGWAKLMNIKGVLLVNAGRYKEAEPVFYAALASADEILRAKIFINAAKLNFFIKDLNRASDLIKRVFELQKDNKRIRLEFLLGYAHLLRGQIFSASGDMKNALNEFKKAEYFFEGSADLRGVGISCMEVARIHIKNKNLTTAWNYLRKSENCLSKLGSEENLGVIVCKGVALYYAGKEEEAQAMLKKAYEENPELGQGRYMIYEILDAYLDTRSRLIHYQKALM